MDWVFRSVALRFVSPEDCTTGEVWVSSETNVWPLFDDCEDCVDGENYVQTHWFDWNQILRLLICDII
jgi:hypothetical protein